MAQENPMYSTTGPAPLLEVEEGLGGASRKYGGGGVGAGGMLGSRLSCFAEWLGAHLSALWVLWFITFVIACCAMDKANTNEKDISDIHTGSGSSNTAEDLEEEYADYWYQRCQGFGAALYGDDVYEYKGHHYQVIGGAWAQMTWRDAEYDCWGRCFGGQPGYLATIGSADENEFLRQKLVEHPGFDAENPSSAWIGGTDMFNEGIFTWIDGYAASSVFYGAGATMYNHFAPGEPNEYGSEDCVEFYSDGFWNDENCYQTLGFFFVEFDA